MILVYIEKYKKVTDVAKELNMKQPSVSFHMKSLEEEMGTVLFESKRGRMVLTEAGKALYPYALKITGLAAEAKKVVRDYAILDKGTLHIGADSTIGTYLLPELISIFSNKYPGTRLQMTIKPTHMIHQMLQNQDIDIAFCQSSLPRQGIFDGFQHEHLWEDDLVVIFGPTHPFSKLQQLSPQLIAKQFFIQHAEGSCIKEFILAWSNVNVIHLWERIQMDSPEAVKLAVSHNDHISFFPRKGIQAELAQGTLMCLPIPEQTNSTLSSYMAYPPDSSQSSLRSEFVAFIKEHMKANL
ncbi:hypothetical protein PBAT_17180 [Paenibacillus antarcticus]|uniref:HTH lysR-type domain-containing protein n=2 Tax=Paenibacillus antarcticus TaxID=253703 RepID=A0A162MG12_9BACL|nr:LysR family transcriptional regulator [Paenibacillus antarcticus]OAB43953.1 hypothetical protein PBAT_17180 [Paenibacillus antarcticus]